MKTALMLIFSIALILYSSGARISLFPFKVEFPNWVHLIGLVLVAAGAILLALSNYHDGYSNGYKEGFTECKKIVKEIINENNEK